MRIDQDLCVNFDRQIGKGGQATVFFGTLKEEIVAVKVFSV
jgi:hypothetical protein